MMNQKIFTRLRFYLSLISFLLVVGVIATPDVRAQKADEKVTATINPDDLTDPFFKKVYKDFYETYKLGPDDELAIRVLNQPDYSLEKIKISPVGRIYHPLLGDVEVAGLTVDQLSEKLAVDLSQYIINPKLSVSLLEANSAKIGVLGDVTHPGIVVMTRPMTVLDALSATGGVSDLGNKSNVTLLRQSGYDRPQTLKIDVKRILEGKANPEENLRLQAGDTIIVHGNKRKKIGQVTSLLGFGNFLAFLLGR
ncbi:MAG: polysaccharide biosynthesis/export family protein [Acidobacteriota bacterium]